MVAQTNPINPILDPTNSDTWPMFLDVDQVAQVLDVERHTIYQMIGSKRLRAKKIGREWRIKKSDLLNL